MPTLTIEALETLAQQLESDEEAEKARLERLIAAYARILAVRAPNAFERKATRLQDEDGHSDNSFPPDEQYCDRTGPRLLRVAFNRTNDIATEGGYYHAWRRVTEDVGLYVARDGTIYGCTETGTGRLGQFAAHPGDCDRDIDLKWAPRREVSVEKLREVEETMRTLVADGASVQPAT